MSNWIIDIAQYLKDYPNQANFFSDNVFAYNMPEGAHPALVVVPPLNGVNIDYDMPGRYRASFQVVVRHKNPAQSENIANEVIEMLNMRDSTIGGFYVYRLHASQTPITYPVSESDFYESSDNFEIVFIDSRLSGPSSTITLPNQSGIKIYFDHSTGGIFVEGYERQFVAQSLEAIQNTDRITILSKYTGDVVLANKHYSLFMDETGNTFGSASDVIQYLEDEFDRQLTGGQIDFYEHIQGSPSSVWTVNHGLGNNPSDVSVYVGGELVIASAVNIDNNTLEVRFNDSQTGSVTVSI